MFHVLLISLLILITSYGSRMICAYLELNPEHTYIVTVGHGVSVFIGLLVWALLDKDKRGVR